MVFSVQHIYRHVHMNQVIEPDSIHVRVREPRPFKPASAIGRRVALEFRRRADSWIPPPLWLTGVTGKTQLKSVIGRPAYHRKRVLITLGQSTWREHVLAEQEKTS